MFFTQSRRICCCSCRTFSCVLNRPCLIRFISAFLSLLVQTCCITHSLNQIASATSPRFSLTCDCPLHVVDGQSCHLGQVCREKLLTNPNAELKFPTIVSYGVINGRKSITRAV